MSEDKVRDLEKAVQLEQLEALQLHNAQLETELAGERAGRARDIFTAALRTRMALFANVCRVHGVDPTKYDFDTRSNQLVLREEPAGKNGV